MTSQAGTPGDGFYHQDRPDDLMVALQFLGLPFVLLPLAPQVTQCPSLGGAVAATILVFVAWSLIVRTALDLFRRIGIRVDRRGVAERYVLRRGIRAAWAEVTGLVSTRGGWTIQTIRGDIAFDEHLSDQLRLAARVGAALGPPLEAPSLRAAQEAHSRLSTASGRIWEGHLVLLPRALARERSSGFDTYGGIFLTPFVLLLLAIVPLLRPWAMIKAWSLATWPGVLRADRVGLTAQRGKWRWGCRWDQVRSMIPLEGAWLLGTTQGDLIWRTEAAGRPLIDAIHVAIGVNQESALSTPAGPASDRCLSRSSPPAGVVEQGISRAPRD